MTLGSWERDAGKSEMHPDKWQGTGGARGREGDPDVARTPGTRGGASALEIHELYSGAVAAVRVFMLLLSGSV